MNLNYIKTIITVISASTLLCSCASDTQIRSIPSGAKVYVGVENVGVTPYQYTDTHFVGNNVRVKLVKDGYEDFNTSFTRDEEVDIVPMVTGVFTMVPLLWSMKYKSDHSYELVPATNHKIDVNQNLNQNNIDQYPTTKPSKKKSRK